MNGPRYLIDTSVFIQAYRAFYSFKLCPGFWDSLVSLHNSGVIWSIDRVYDELNDGDEDELTVWSKSTMPRGFFAESTSIEVVKWYAQLQQWADKQSQYSAAAKREFATDADAWLIAYAGAKNMTVVTQETIYQPNIQRRIPIPNVCKSRDIQVPVVDVFMMLERLNITFGWSGGSQPPGPS